MTAEDGFERSSSADPDDSSDGPEVEDVLRHNTEIFKATMQPVVAQSIALKSKVERSGLAESRLSEGKAKWKLASKVKTQYLYQWFEQQVEVTTSNLSQARIYISGTHSDAPHNALQYSRRLRLFMMNNASQGGMTAAKLKKELLSTMETSADMGALPREYTRPDYRMPLGKEIDHLMKHLNNRKRLHKDPFAAVHTFVQRNPDLVFA
ncbi:unnamed protein product [Tilletia controversa]|nr:hypothetical protein CF328_g4120 [Tilletia controversa]CAD6922786.1 unnamed protein product [Tilletia controversa]CAD6929616.1 unnamed protein product [Tilletia controversa]